MNAKIPITVFLALGVSLLIFISIQMIYVANYDPFVKWTHLITSTNSIDQNKIFLIGSSQVGVINATYVQNYLIENNQNFNVYNLAIDGDTPFSRLNDVDKLISLHPHLVIYGIGLRDLEKESSTQVSSITTMEKPMSILPSPHDMFQNLLLPVNEFISSKLDITTSPLVTTQKIFDHFLKIHQKSYDIHAKTPFIMHSYSNTIIRSQEEIKQDFSKSSSLQYTGVVSSDDKQVIALKKIIDKLQSNNIKIVFFTTPYPAAYLETIDRTDLNNFYSIMEKLSQSHNVKIYDFQDKYAKLNIWQDLNHVAVNEDSIIYTDDVSKMILAENGQ